MGARRDQALAGPGRGAEDHVDARDDLDQRLLLMRVQGQALELGPALEGVEQIVWSGALRQAVGEGHDVTGTTGRAHVFRTECLSPVTRGRSSATSARPWWERAVATWPDYAQYQKKTTRTIPVFVLTPANA